MTDPIPKTEDLELEEILESLAEIGRGWVIDQLDGTSFIKDALDGIEQEKAEAKQAILALIEEQKKALLDELKSELRDYRDKYPDADYNDIIGYIVGFQNRPVEKLNTLRGENYESN